MYKHNKGMRTALHVYQDYKSVKSILSPYFKAGNHILYDWKLKAETDKFKWKV